jgi:hypothetical protein
MADKKISELTTITTVDNAADLFPIVDSSAAETKKITPTALKSALALNNVDNTSDANKAISSATQSALDAKASTTSLNSHVTNTSNPHGVTKTQIGLGNCDNTADIDKPISTAVQTALNLKQDSLGFTPENVANKSTSVTTDQASNTKYPSVKSVYDWAVGLFATISSVAAKQDTLVSGTSIKTIEGQSLLGSGNIDLAKGDVGLGNVDNTSDANKPVSTATQTSLDAKTNKLIVANRQTASYTLVLSDADKLVEMNVGSANNLTIPLNSSVAFATGTQILLAQYGAGQTTLVPTSGVTIRSNGAKVKLNAQYSGATLIKIAENEWYLFGDIA